MSRHLDRHPPVPTTHQRYLAENEGHWTIFDARYILHPELMPDDYLAENVVVDRYAVDRLSAQNVRAAIYSFTPTEKVKDRECRKWAFKVLEDLNAKAHVRERETRAALHGAVVGAGGAA